ncbi:MAG: CPBP family intramembrane metalloprotease [Dysgonamonadaceae bacterium]|jgi:membrane protease YdiL (CAAX protease family)|nr:CPBP family intramembrane metalloprotease [Dysgonamonadaceae bacterium]
MNLQAIFKDAPFLHQLLMTIAVAACGALLSIFASAACAALTAGSESAGLESLNNLRMMQLFSELGTFLFPALFLAYIFGEKGIAAFLQLRKPRMSPILLTALTVLLAIPFLNLTVYLNEQLALPNFLKPLETWMKHCEETAQQLTDQLLQADTAGTLVFNLFLIGAVAAVSEEFMFRGVVQRVFEKISGNPHLVIWMVAFLFSAIHLQFYGFVPRMLLGALTGYLLLWTKSLWIPVTAHFVNNATGVLAAYFFSDTPLGKQLELIGTGSTLWMAGASLILTLYLCKIFTHHPPPFNSSPPNY